MDILEKKPFCKLLLTTGDRETIALGQDEVAQILVQAANDGALYVRLPTPIGILPVNIAQTVAVFPFTIERNADES